MIYYSNNIDVAFMTENMEVSLHLYIKLYTFQLSTKKALSGCVET